MRNMSVSNGETERQCHLIKIIIADDIYHHHIRTVV